MMAAHATFTMNGSPSATWPTASTTAACAGAALATAATTLAAADATATCTREYTHALVSRSFTRTLGFITCITPDASRAPPRARLSSPPAPRVTTHRSIGVIHIHPHPGAIDDDAHRRRRRRAAPRRDPVDASSHRTPSRASSASSDEDDARVDPSTRPSPRASPRARARARPRARVAFDGWMRAPTRARRRPSHRRLGTRAREIRRIRRAPPLVVAPFVVAAIARAVVVHALDRPSPRRSTRDSWRAHSYLVFLARGRRVRARDDHGAGTASGVGRLHRARVARVRRDRSSRREHDDGAAVGVCGRARGRGETRVRGRVTTCAR